MRLRRVVILALSTTACAGVIGLGDYEVESESADAGSGYETGAASSSGSASTKDGAGPDGFVDAQSDADGSNDAGTAKDGAVTDADAGKTDGGSPPVDAGPDAYANRDGIACSDKNQVCDGTPPCCREGSGNFSCLSSFTCQGPAGGEVFECDDNADCTKKGGAGSVCCVDVYAGDGKPRTSFCAGSCNAGIRHACVTNAECGAWGAGLTCQLPQTTYNTALPLLKICR